MTSSDGFSLRERLRARTALFGAWTSLGHPSITELFTAAGVDVVGIDLEHSTISEEQAQQLIAVSHAGGVACLPRIASHDGAQIRRLLDAGADGIIVPNVSTPAQARQIIAWSKYPPMGRRSYGVARAQGYGHHFEDYTAGWNARSAIILQVESIKGVEAIDGLLEPDAIDGVMVGPYDLSGSLGIPGQLGHPRVTEACARVITACRRAGKACGTHLIEPTAESVMRALASGFTFVVLASDVFILWKWGQRMRSLVQTCRAARAASRPRRQARSASRPRAAR